MLGKKYIWYVLGTALVFFQAEGALERSSATHDYISTCVTREIVEQVNDGSLAKCKHQKRCVRFKKRCPKNKDGIYLAPNWPFYSQYFCQTDLVHVLFNFDTASSAYSGNGHTQDLSKLIFGEQAITIKEILLSSKLANQGKLGSVRPPLLVGGATAGDQANVNATQKDHFLSFLADQEVVFNASVDQFVAAINYAHYFKRVGITVGFHAPLKIRHDKLRLTNDISQENLIKIKNVEAGKNPDGTAGPAGLAADDTLQFFKNFTGLEDFVTQILNAKGISFNKEQTVTGFSDLTAYANIEIPSRYVDYFLTGVSLLIPTAHERDASKLWPNDLGNGGFVQAAGYASFLWQPTRLCNPYVHIKGTYVFRESVNRRVPMRNTYDGTNFNGVQAPGGTSTAGKLLLDENLVFASSAAPAAGIGDLAKFSLDDSTVRQFADKAIKVHVTPGAEFFCRLGNTIDSFFARKSFLDIYYDLRVKGKEHVKSHNDFNTDILTHNTASIAHIVGINHSYQFNAHIRTRLGLTYVFAGRNVPKTFGVDFAFNAEF